jgi:hypothetical protein
LPSQNHKRMSYLHIVSLAPKFIFQILDTLKSHLCLLIHIVAPSRSEALNVYSGQWCHILAYGNVNASISPLNDRSHKSRHAKLPIKGLSTNLGVYQSHTRSDRTAKGLEHAWDAVGVSPVKRVLPQDTPSPKVGTTPPLLELPTRMQPVVPAQM